MELILVRHGGADAPAGICVGRSDVPLAVAGFTAMQRLAAGWTAPPPRFLFSSDLKRAQQSAQVLAARFALEPLADARLREADFGEWEGRRWETVIAQDAERYRHWAENWVIQPAPGGESFADVVRRTGAWLSALLASTREGDCVLAVAHQGSIRALLCHALGLPPARAPALRVDPAHAVRIACRGGQFEVCYSNVPSFQWE